MRSYRPVFILVIVSTPVFYILISYIHKNMKNIDIDIGQLSDENWKYVNRSDPGVYTICNQSLVLANQSSNASCVTMMCNVTNREQAPCSFPLVNAHMTSCGYFPSSKVWTRDNNLLLPNICTMSPGHQSAGHFRNFVKQRPRLSNILVMGDSHGIRYSHHMLQIIRNAGYTCIATKWEPEGFHQNSAYYHPGDRMGPMPALRSPARTCRSCTSFKHICMYNDHVIRFEYISLILGAQTSMLNSTYCSHHWAPVCNYTDQAEFIFQYYLSQSPPDLVVMFSTFSHDCTRPFNVSSHALAHVMDVMDDALPPTSDVIWITATPPNKGWPEKLKVKPGTFPHGYVRFNSTERLNHMLYETLTSRMSKHTVSDKPRVYGFPDLFSAALPKADRTIWATDYIHYKPIWYQRIAEYIFNMLPSILLSN